MTIIIRVALQELSYTTYIEIRCHCFRLGSLASGYLLVPASRRFVGTFGGEPREFRTIHAALFESWKREGSCKFDLLERDGAGRQHYKQCSQMNQLIALV